MSSSTETEQPTDDSAKPSLPDDVLPPVEAPTAGFILQLFFIPMIIVAIIVMVWMMFSWLAHMGSNPRDLVKKLEAGDDAAWQRAGTLADMLRTREHLKYDVELAAALSGILDREIAKGGTEKNANQNQIHLRIYLCRALGEFQVPSVLPSLLNAARTERDASNIEPPDPRQPPTLTELHVRRTALEALAIAISNWGAEDYRDNSGLLEVLIDASKGRGASSADETLRRELRSTAAYTLGVLGGETALDRLAVMVGVPDDRRYPGDSYANARFNAATGLARHGDLRAVPELVYMLDPDNDEIVETEEYESSKSFKRSLVITSGIQAIEMLIENNNEADLQPLEEALKKLAESDSPISVRTRAKETLHRLQERASAVAGKS